MNSPVAPAWIPADVDLPVGGTVAVVGRPGEGAATQVLTWLGGSCVEAIELEFTGDVDDLHVPLTAFGPFDLIVDTCGGGSAAARFQLGVYHLRPGGRLLLRLDGDALTGPRARLEEMVRAAADLRSSPTLKAPHLRRDRAPRREKDLHGLAAALADLELGEQHVSARLELSVLPTLADSDVNAVLGLRPSLGEVLSELPGETMTTDGRFTSTSAEDHPLAPAEAPPLFLRAYAEVTCAPRMVAIGDGIVLPDTFRRPSPPRPSSPALVDWGPHTVLEPDLGSPSRLEGTYFYLDNTMRGHFGHALTEQVSRLWAWPAALARHPDLQALVFSRDGDELSGWEHQLLAAGGVSRERVVTCVEPVVVQRLVSSSPAYVIDLYAHPVMRHVYDLIGDALDADPHEGRPARLFLTRRGGLRECRNNDEVEALFADHGFTILAPEEHDLREQVAMVRAASDVAGYAGSAMFHLALTDRPKRVLVISSDNYHVANEKYLCALRGHDLTVIRCRAEIARLKTFSKKVFHSPFTVDLGAEGIALQQWVSRR